MKNIAKLILVFFLALFIAFLIIKFIPNDKKAIEKQFKTLSSTISITPKESAVQTGVKLSSLSELFDDECEIEATHEWINGIYTAQELASHISRTRLNFKSLQLSFYDMVIEVINDEARVNFTARLTARTKDDKFIEEIREVSAKLKKKDKKWKFAKFAIIETLKK